MSLSSGTVTLKVIVESPLSKQRSTRGAVAIDKFGVVQIWCRSKFIKTPNRVDLVGA